MDKSSLLFMYDALFNLGSITNAKFGWFEPGDYYELIDINGTQYIHVDNKRANDDKRMVLDIGKISRNKDLLFDLLVCVPDVLSINWEDIKSFIDLNRLLKWCHKYGPPYSSQNNSIWFDNGESKPYNFSRTADECVSFEPLCIEVSVICLLYNLWLSYASEDTKKFKVVTSILLRSEQCKILWLNPNITIQEINDNLQKFMARDLSTIKMRLVLVDLLTELLQHHLRNACYLEFDSVYCESDIKIEDIEKNKKFYDSAPLIQVSTMTNSAMDLCFFQLYSIVNSNGSAKHIKECQNCHEIFWARNGHSKYCPNCDRRMVWQNNHTK